MAAIIQDGNQHLVHHMEVFQCQSDDQEEFSGNCNDRNKPIQSKSCSHVIAAWAMGEGPIFYPREAGLPIGGLGAHKYIMVEIHYNNIHKLTGVIDSSGFE
uniref:Cu2_monooxygen domain-containing protein n=1 Tax=Heterorhabditis bacteriophora TaxID=37862 RepID=A0A1I7X4N1_HETBA